MHIMQARHLRAPRPGLLEKDAGHTGPLLGRKVKFSTLIGIFFFIFRPVTEYKSYTFEIKNAISFNVFFAQLWLG